MYVIESKINSIELRDGPLASDPMYRLTTGVPVLFKNLPPGCQVPGDGQVKISVAQEGVEIKNPDPQPLSALSLQIIEGEKLHKEELEARRAADAEKLANHKVKVASRLAAKKAADEAAAKILKDEADRRAGLKTAVSEKPAPSNEEAADEAADTQVQDKHWKRKHRG